MTRATARVGSIRIRGRYYSMAEVERLVTLGERYEAERQPRLPAPTTTARPESPPARPEQARAFLDSMKPRR